MELGIRCHLHPNEIKKLLSDRAGVAAARFDPPLKNPGRADLNPFIRTRHEPNELFHGGRGRVPADGGSLEWSDALAVVLLEQSLVDVLRLHLSSTRVSFFTIDQLKIEIREFSAEIPKAASEIVGIEDRIPKYCGTGRELGLGP